MRERTLGVDVGGTKIRWAVLDRGRVTIAREVKTPRAQKKLILFFKKLFAEISESGVRKAGIGVPGFFSGTVFRHAPNMRFLRPIDLGTLAPKTLLLRVDNDASCFALSELYAVKTKNMKFMAFTIGTGIGRAAVEKSGKKIMIEEFPGPERWEKRYQKIAKGPQKELAAFLGPLLAELTLKRRPDHIVIGGGRIQNAGFPALLRKELRKAGVRCPVHLPRFRKNAGAVGAAALWVHGPGATPGYTIYRKEARKNS